MGGGSIICSNVITHVLTNSSEMTLKSIYFAFDQLKANTLVIALLNEPFMNSDRDVRTTSVIGASMPNHSRIGILFMNKYFSSRYEAVSTVRSDVSKLDKLDTAVQQSSTNKRDMASSQIEEGSPKSIFPEIVEESNLSERMKLANSLGVQTPKLAYFRHPPMQTYTVGHQSNRSVPTRVVYQDGIWKPTDGMLARRRRMATLKLWVRS